MDSNLNLPDIVSQYSDAGYEIKPGIQFSGSILSSEIDCGGSTFLNLIVQNALDVPISGEVFIDMPSRKLLKRTYLSGIEKIKFSLEETEVSRIVIPISSTFQTPEGKYLIKIKLKGRGGKRVRGAKELIDPDKALMRSVAESA